MFVPPDRLAFDLANVAAQAIADWEAIQPLGFRRPVVDSCGDFIVAEMEARGLRQLVDTNAWFDSAAAPADFRDCIFAALDRWLIEVSQRRSSEEMEEYRRQCGE
jgi:hypothetical protein